MKDKVFFFIKIAVVLVVAAEIVFGIYSERQRKAIQAMPAYFIYDSSRVTRVSYFGDLADSDRYVQACSDTAAASVVLDPAAAVMVDSYSPGGRFAHFHAFKPWKNNQHPEVRYQGYVLTVFLHKNAAYIPPKGKEYAVPGDDRNY